MTVIVSDRPLSDLTIGRNALKVSAEQFNTYETKWGALTQQLELESGAGTAMSSHYTFQIRTFWLGLLWMFITGMIFAIGIPLSFILIGIPMLILAKLMFGMGFIWWGLRSVVGVIYLARDEPYPRPYAVLL